MLISNNLIMKKYTRGFTLIELLVVIAIIGILASIVLVSLNSARNKGKDARVISDVQQLRTAFESGYNGSSYPDLQSNAINGSGPQTAATAALIADIATQTGTSVVFVTTPAGNATVTGYAIYGPLPSQNNLKWFCIASTGKTNQSAGTDSGTDCP